MEKNELREVDILALQVVRRIMHMVAHLHQRGYESLYLNPIMSPSGCHWRYEIGAMEEGKWPNRQKELLSVRDSITANLALQWANISDTVEVLADKFVSAYPKIMKAARKPNSEYTAWYRQMLQQTEPDGVLIFWRDFGPNYEYAFLFDDPDGWRMPMPPGYRPLDTLSLRGESGARRRRKK